MSDTFTLSKKYDDAYYSPAYFYTSGQTISVEIDSVTVNDDFDSSSGNLFLDRPRSKSKFRYGPITRLVDMLNVKQQITVQGNIRDTYDTDTTSTLSGVVGTTITLADATSFASSNGVIQIDNELIFYGTKNGNDLEDCRRAYAHTVEPDSEHTNGTTVYERSTSAMIKKYNLELLRSRGGTITVDWRIFQYKGIITAMGFKDSKTKHTGNFTRAVQYDVTLTLRIGYQKGEEPTDADI